MNSKLLTTLVALLMAGGACATEPAPQRGSRMDFVNDLESLRQIRAGRQTFRYATFGDEAFWGDALGLHEAVAGAAHGGTGRGLSPAAARSPWV